MKALDKSRIDLPQGTLDMLILKVVALGPIHGYGISQRLQQISKEALQVPQGSLYPALHRLENRGWLFGGMEGLRDRKRSQILFPYKTGQQAARRGR